MQAPPTHVPRAPPYRPSSRYSPFLIGRDICGNWVVCDQAGLCGAVFVERSEALRFAMLEDDEHPQAVIMVPGILDFSSGGPAKTVVNQSKPACEEAKFVTDEHRDAEPAVHEAVDRQLFAPSGHGARR